jgi:hypothetical protein
MDKSQWASLFVHFIHEVFHYGLPLLSGNLLCNKDFLWVQIIDSHRVSSLYLVVFSRPNQHSMLAQACSITTVVRVPSTMFIQDIPINISLYELFKIPLYWLTLEGLLLLK